MEGPTLPLPTRSYNAPKPWRLFFAYDHANDDFIELNDVYGDTPDDAMREHFRSTFKKVRTMVEGSREVHEYRLKYACLSVYVEVSTIPRTLPCLPSPTPPASRAG